MNVERQQAVVRYFIILSIFMRMTESVIIYTVLHITEVVLFGRWSTAVK